MVEVISQADLLRRFRTSPSPAQKQQAIRKGTALGVSSFEAPLSNRPQILGATTDTTQRKFDPSAQFDPSGKTFQSAFQEGLVDEFGNPISKGPSQADVSGVFNPIFEALDVAGGALRSGFDIDKAATEARFGLQSGRLEDERTRLRGETTERQEDFNETLKSALTQANRAFQQLQQRGRAQFGARSNVGRGISELSRQEFFRQQGTTRREGVRGSAAFSKEFDSIGKFIADKKSELDLWKNQTLGELKKNLNNQLAQLQSQRGQTESDKAQARLGLIQDSINRARAIQDQDKQFRQSLALAGLNQLETSSGRKFTPNEINAVTTQFLGGKTAITVNPSSFGSVLAASTSVDTP